MYKWKDKPYNIHQSNRYMLAKTLHMFEYEGLPDTIPHRELEKALQEKGYAFIMEIEGKLYALTGGLGGVPDAYGRPTHITIANPYLKFDKTVPLTEGVLVINDDYLMGLLPLFDKYHTFLAENDINMVMYGYATRMTRMVSAPDDKTRESAQRAIDKSIEGETTVVSENIVFDGVRVQGDKTPSAAITSLIEYSQYLKATMFHEVGLSSNNNLKRERLVTAEVDQSESSIMGLVYAMMACRLDGMEEVNVKFGTDIKVGFGSVWKDKQREAVDDVVEESKPTDVTEGGENSTDEEKEPTDEHVLENDPDGVGPRTSPDSGAPRSEEGTGTPDQSSESGKSGGADGEGSSGKALIEPAQLIETLEREIKEVEDMLADPDMDSEQRPEFERLLSEYRDQLSHLQ